MRALLLFVLLLTPPASAQDLVFSDSFEKDRIFFITLQITIYDNDQRLTAQTFLFAEMVQKVWKVDSPGALVGTNVYDVCSNGQGGAVDTVQEISENYKSELTEQEQLQFSSDPEYFADFVNDSNGNLLVCDPEETDGKYVTRYVLTIAEV